MNIRRFFVRIHELATRLTLGQKRVRNAARVKREAEERRRDIERQVEELEVRCAPLALKRAVDWGPSFAAVARAQEEHPDADVSLPLDVDGEPSPAPEEAGRDDVRPGE